MWYWDYFPPSGKYAKKPLTKEQLRKIQENYQKAGKIAEHVQELEEKHSKDEKEKADRAIDSLFL